jgi:hypothetical protein
MNKAINNNYIYSNTFSYQLLYLDVLFIDSFVLYDDVTIYIDNPNFLPEDLDRSPWDTQEKISRNGGGYKYRCNYYDKETSTNFRVSSYNNKYYLYISGSFPKIVFKNGYGFVRQNDLKVIREYLKKNLKRLNISNPIDYFYVKRVDLYLDLIYPTTHIVNSLAPYKRILYMNQFTKTYGDTYLRYGNKQRTLAIYDKSSQHAKKNRIELPVGTTRLEYRFLTSVKCSNEGFNKFADLEDINKQRHKLFSILNNVSSEINESDFMLTPSFGASLINTIKNNDVHTAGNNLLTDIATYGVDLFLKQFGGLQGFNLIIRDSDLVPQKKANSIKLLTDLFSMNNKQQAEQNKNPARRLFEALMEKLQKSNDEHNNDQLILMSDGEENINEEIRYDDFNSLIDLLSD